jgi:hypothetical protein
MHSAIPKVDAPGLEARLRADGSYRLLWRAPRWAIRAGYARQTANLAFDLRDPDVHPLIAQACRNETQAARDWCDRKADLRPADGTLGWLCDLYQTHEASPFHGVKHNTRRLYLYELRMIQAAWGARRLDALTAVDFVRWFKQAVDSVSGDGGERKAHGLLKRIRALVSFGIIAEVPGCLRLKQILGEMEFATPGPRSAALTYPMALAVIAKAHELGFPSVALAQALQFETGLRQSDVLGQWEPCAEDDKSPFRTAKYRWAPGLLWTHINADLILDLTPVKTIKSSGLKTVHDLKAMPLVTTEFDRIDRDRRVGPVVLAETTGMPWEGTAFSKRWRKIARAAGVPDAVWNRDSRAGALSEADEAGAQIEKIQRMAAHTSPRMTARYMRGEAVKASREVAQLRSEKRRGAQE